MSKKGFLWEYNLLRPIQCLICLYIICGEGGLGGCILNGTPEKEEKR